GITEVPRPQEYFAGLRRWLTEQDGLGIILRWAQEYVNQHGHVLPGVHAPMSKAKRQVIEDSRSDGERLIIEWAQELVAKNNHKKDEEEENREIVVRLDMLRHWLAHRKADLDDRIYGHDGRLKLETPEKIASLLRTFAGLYLPGIRFKAGGVWFRVVANF